MTIKPLYIKLTCDNGAFCCAGGTSDIVRRWSLKDFDTKFFLENVYPELVSGNIYNVKINRGYTTLTQAEWPAHFLKKLDIEKFLSEIEDPEILADVKDRMKYKSS